MMAVGEMRHHSTEISEDPNPGPCETEVTAHGAGPSLMLMVLASRFLSLRGTRKAGDFQLWHQSIQDLMMHWEEPDADTRTACKGGRWGGGGCTYLCMHISVFIYECVCAQRAVWAHRDTRKSIVRYALAS